MVDQACAADACHALRYTLRSRARAAAARKCRPLSSFAAAIFNMTVSSLKPAEVETKPTSDRGADLIGIEPLAFDLAALDHVLG